MRSEQTEIWASVGGHKPPWGGHAPMATGLCVCFPCAVTPLVPRCRVPRSVTVGTSAELQCLENGGFPAPVLRWFLNNQELPPDPRSSRTFSDSSYTMDPRTGSLVRCEGKAGTHCFPCISIHLSPAGRRSVNEPSPL